MTVEQYIYQFKKDGIQYFNMSDARYGQMFRYSQTYMDENDLAQHQFRNETAGGISLDSNVEREGQEKNIYDQYKEMKDRKKQQKDLQKEK